MELLQDSARISSSGKVSFIGEIDLDFSPLFRGNGS
jgi:hypothetical protein